MGEPEVSKFLSHLAVEGKVSASTQNQALSAILFLYQEVLKQELGWINNVKRAKKALSFTETREEKRYGVLWMIYDTFLRKGGMSSVDPAAEYGIQKTPVR